MAAGIPITPETHARAIELMQAGVLGRNAIARELGVSGAAITNIAQEIGHEFDWRMTELATRALRVSTAELRETLAKMALIKAMDAAEQMTAPHTMIQWQASTPTQTGGWQEYVLDQPTPSDQRNYATIFGIMVTKAAELTRASSAAGDAGTISFVEDLANMLKRAAAAERGESAEQDDDPTVPPEQVSRDDLLTEYADEYEIADADEPDATDRP